MNNSTVIEDRLARYRPTLDHAIEHHASAPEVAKTPGAFDIIDSDVDIAWDSTPVVQTPPRARLLVGAAAVALIGGLGVFLVTRSDQPATAPANAPEPVVTATATTPNIDDAVTDTAPATVVAGSGLTPACPAGTETVGTGTLYLGGPRSDQNLATNGFIFSLPQGPTPVDVAMKAIGLPVIGLECSISGTPTADANVVNVLVDPPAVPAALGLDVTISETNDVIGVTRIDGGTSFEITTTEATPSLRLLDGVPTSAQRVQVRFKKGDDVWELSADPTPGADIALIVPGGETDNFATEPVDWVLFTLIGANERIVGAGGQVI